MYDRNEPVFADYRYVSGNLSVEWEYIGEGSSGDYDPDDPTDDPMLRANLMILDNKGEWVQPDSASYCTLAVIDTPKQLLDDASYALIQVLRENNGATWEGGEPWILRKAMQEWTWTEFNAEKDSITIPRQHYFKNYRYIRER